MPQDSRTMPTANDNTTDNKPSISASTQTTVTETTSTPSATPTTPTTPTESPLKIKPKALLKTSKRTKSFSGCYTCRRRKIACDLTKPSCLKCQKSGFVCEGYLVKLRWSQPIRFDIYGYQLPNQPNQETEYCQRRSIEFVKYPKSQQYELYDEMDIDLAKLHNQNMPLLSETPKQLGPFGVFRGSVEEKPRKKRKTKYAIPSKEATAQSKQRQLDKAAAEATAAAATTTESQKQSNNKQQQPTTQFQRPLQTVNNQVTQNTVSFLHSTATPALSMSNMSDNQSSQNNMGNEWLSIELVDAALLTASALNGDTHFLDMFKTESPYNVGFNNNAISSNGNNATVSQGLPSSNSLSRMGEGEPMAHVGNASASNQGTWNKNSSTHSSMPNFATSTSNIHSTTALDTRYQQTNEAVPDQMLHMLFQGRNNTSASHQNESTLSQQPHNQSQVPSTNKQQPNPRHQSIPPQHSSQIGPIEEIPASLDMTNVPAETSKFARTDKEISNNTINIHAGKGAHMPKTIMEILGTTPLPRSLAIDKFGIPTTSLNVHPTTRYLLNYYIEDVADMMTVIPLPKNPWKFIYFPRAIMAVGELASLGKTSNAKNCLLNALLAVSAFNIQSKFTRGSDEMKYYVDLGIQLRQQATNFLNKCLDEDILQQKYKDVLVAVLSMVTIDVVWGTMSACKIHLDHCEKIIEKKMKVKKKLSTKAIILHRIFSSLKLLQDSTSLENISLDEIFLNESNYRHFIIGANNGSKEDLERYNNNDLMGLFRNNRGRRQAKEIREEQMIQQRQKQQQLQLEFEQQQRQEDLERQQQFALEKKLDNISDISKSKPNSPTDRYSTPGSTGNLAVNSPISKGVYNEKITDNGKVRIEFIVNNDDDYNTSDRKLQDDTNNGIPAFIDITRSSFQPSKNKLEDKIVSSDAIYGLPNSLILMFSEVVHLVRFRKFHDDQKKLLPNFFDDLSNQLELKLLGWKLEWNLTLDEDTGSTPGSIATPSTSSNMNSTTRKQNFISPRYEGIYHHVMSFYHALIIYFYRFVEDVNPMYLQERVEKVLHHLNEIQRIVENNRDTSYIIPLFWQGFIAGSEAMTLFLQNGFNLWGQHIAQTGIGTYWNARQIMLEIWRRKNHNVKTSSWVDVLRDWKTNVMLT